jgi:hypothetical protein
VLLAKREKSTTAGRITLKRDRLMLQTPALGRLPYSALTSSWLTSARHKKANFASECLFYCTCDM